MGTIEDGDEYFKGKIQYNNLAVGCREGRGVDMTRNKIIAVMFIVPFFASIASGSVIQVPGDQPTIQAGIDNAGAGDTVLVSDGTYAGMRNRDLDFHGIGLTVMSENGPGNCVIDCEGMSTDRHRAFLFDDAEEETAVVEGFTLRYGYHDAGGAIHCWESSPTIRNCVIQWSAAENGGGIYCAEYSSPMILSCTISVNTAFDYGGGIYCDDYSSPVIAGCSIASNSGYDGGGICCDDFSCPEISCCSISGNRTDYDGSGIYCVYHSSPVIDNCLFYGNSGYRGGGIYFDDYTTTTINCCTFAANTADYSGGGLVTDLSTITVKNSIFWGNTAVWEGQQIDLDVNSTLTISYSNVQGGMNEVGVCGGCTLNWNDGMIDEDPLFVSGPDGDYYLSHTAAGQPTDSPCIDAGDMTAADVCCKGADGTVCMDDLTVRTDSAGDAAAVDLGFHYQPPVSATPTYVPTCSPTPTHSPTTAPTNTHTQTPTQTSTVVPTNTFTAEPTMTPTVVPTEPSVPAVHLPGLILLVFLVSVLLALKNKTGLLCSD